MQFVRTCRSRSSPAFPNVDPGAAPLDLAGSASARRAGPAMERRQHVTRSQRRLTFRRDPGGPRRRLRIGLAGVLDRPVRALVYGEHDGFDPTRREAFDVVRRGKGGKPRQTRRESGMHSRAGGTEPAGVGSVARSVCAIKLGVLACPFGPVPRWRKCSPVSGEGPIDSSRRRRSQKRTPSSRSSRKPAFRDEDPRGRSEHGEELRLVRGRSEDDCGTGNHDDESCALSGLPGRAADCTLDEGPAHRGSHTPV